MSFDTLQRFTLQLRRHHFPLPNDKDSSFTFCVFQYFFVQIQKETYDLEANLALLKLYQFYPTHSNVEVIQKLLLKALLDMPTNAFLLSSYLIPERHHERKEVEPIRTLYHMLEECRFKEFWASQELKDIQESSPIPGLETSARTYGYDILSSSHQRYGSGVVCKT